MKNLSISKILIALVISYGLAYVFLFIIPLVTMNDATSESLATSTETITTIIAFLVYAVGTTVLFFNEKTGGIVLFAWHFMIWVFSLLLWPDSGMDLILCFPVFLFALFLIINWYKKYDQRYREPLRRLNLALKLLTINFTAIYLLVVLAETVPRLLGWDLVTQVDELASWNYKSFPGIFLLIILFFYLVGVAISNRWQWVAGLIFIAWYISVLLLSYESLEFAQTGPHAVFGITIFVLGILYLILFMKKNESENQKV